MHRAKGDRLVPVGVLPVCDNAPTEVQNPECLMTDSVSTVSVHLNEGRGRVSGHSSPSCAFKTLKRQEKMHLKMSSAANNYLILLTN